VAKAQSNAKFVICNADEGDPGAFMDRSVLESDPHRVIEGMAIAGAVVGASQGYVYVRAEYPLAVKRVRTAIARAERLGLLGRNIFSTEFSFDIKVRLGAGAFVCGEETALIASIEGRRGSPRPRPPFPAEFGLWGHPTLINNVETFANVAPIIRRGGAWFAGIGTEKSKGTKVFALAGRVKNTGLIEVPMGTKLRDIVYDIGGGIPNGRRFKAVQTGGPSGGCVPEQFLDMPVDYESLAKVGSIMGSGGMIVMDETSCMVDVAKFFMEFCMTESCGKCVPCRAGTTQIYNILNKITEGHATLADIDTLEELSDLLKATSLCGLGQTAPNPVMSTLRYFRDEYMAHIEHKICPAGVCKMNGHEEGTQ
jgi:bidirectional [NiFe] hydrogenase diaphorase subunit